ncbi:MAG: hypothetical protein ACT4PX_12870 [Actinomycetota bacterium]
MRFRLGLCIGFGTGYYLGSMAGRERFEQINRTICRIKRSEAYEVATEKAREAVEVGVDRATDLVDSVRGNGNGDEPSSGTDPYLRQSPPYQ